MKPYSQSPDFVRHTQETAKKKVRNIRSGSKTQLSRKATPHLELYQMEGCPFSHAVRNRLTRLGLDFIAHTIPPQGHPLEALKREQLVQAGGKDQIPFMVDHKSGVKLYESGAILTYLNAEYGGDEENPSALLQGIAKSIESTVRARADQFIWRFRAPLDAAESLRDDAWGAWHTVSGTWRWVGEQIRSRAAGAANGASDGGETAKVARAIRVDVASATDAA